jgi:diacylglycerol kinase (ATP)
LPKELDKAAGVIAAGVTRMMDLCEVNGRLFDNNAAIGLEPYITLIQQRITRLRGTLRYLVATLRGVIDNPQWEMHLEWQGGQYDGPITLVTVGNNPRTGGIFYVTPHANPFDGLLTFVYGFMPTRLQILRLLPRTMKSGAGNYVEHPDIHEVNSPWLRVHSEKPTPSHADGEIQSEAIQDLEYRVIPARLPILMV